MTGTTNRKTIVVPCIVKSWLYVCGSRNVLSACDSWSRMSSASTPPSMKKAKVRTRYMIPIRLWSVVVTQLVQPVRSGATAWATTSGSGVVVREGAVVVAMGEEGPSSYGLRPASTALRWAAAAVLATLMSALRRASQRSKAAGVTAWTCAIMFAWPRPQSSAQLPRKT